ncbi:DUF3299 domain-containing protein [Alterisphingorhabdus coralli]|uniref:DUF3299 domain-containing protein n=1 Tax=Alterisphingorhabdus coralli TaxID=3071408 RepID=A0AA97F3Z6_9SPHN|nr:DUF3299 domain-containing protein [Parasphingorhabdus sp. SCSIO 66989]WOE73871.1 DUF3299 domain-containing protein [Parasphingorhabdus sp. SCSIO 66989]
MMMRKAWMLAAATAALCLPSSVASTVPSYKDGGQAPAPVEDIWKPAATPKGGISWKTLEATGEETRRDAEGYILSKPKFTQRVRALEGKRIRVAGWMMPLENGAQQNHFVLLAYPPGCPFHFHAMPNQFIEVYADRPFRTNERTSFVVSGVLELTGYDESGIFYRMKQARPI